MKKLHISKTLCTDKNKGYNYGQATYDALGKLGIDVEVMNTKNPWARDYMPVLNADNQWVNFQYKPNYMAGTKKYESWHPENSFFESLGIHYQNSELIIDGGNVELLGSTAIITDRFFKDNCKHASEYRANYNALKNALKVDKLIALPEYPFDLFGHIDGMLRLVTENKVLISNPEIELQAIEADENKPRKKLLTYWFNAFMAALLNLGFEIEYLPAFTDDYTKHPTSAVGNYLNFAHFGDKILMPSFKGFDAENAKAKNKIEQLFNKQVHPIEATNLARYGGGVINCITWVK